MLRKRREAAAKVAAGLFAVEEAIDQALKRAAELNALMPGARTDANLSAVVGQDAFEGAAETFASLAKARHHIVQTHHRLEETKNRIGLRTHAMGDGTTKPAVGGLTVIEGGGSAAA